jgi:glutamate-1-semialdehyde 2,1-aminomutase
VITEAAPANMGVVPPIDDFDRVVARTAHEFGALLISDEVMTGFRVSRSGWYGLAGPDGPDTADLFTYGKVIGGGLPVAAFGGRADVMALLAPDGPVYQAGTLSGNPVATACGLATLQNCTDEVYTQLNHVARAIAEMTSAALTAAGVGHRVQRAGNLFSVFFVDADVATTIRREARTRLHSPDSSMRCLAREFAAAVRVRGLVRLAAHDDDALERIAAALPKAAAAAARQED